MLSHTCLFLVLNSLWVWLLFLGSSGLALCFTSISPFISHLLLFCHLAPLHLSVPDTWGHTPPFPPQLSHVLALLLESSSLLAP